MNVGKYMIIVENLRYQLTTSPSSVSDQFSQPSTSSLLEAESESKLTYNLEELARPPVTPTFPAEKVSRERVSLCRK